MVPELIEGCLQVSFSSLSFLSSSSPPLARQLSAGWFLPVNLVLLQVSPCWNGVFADLGVQALGFCPCGEPRDSFYWKTRDNKTGLKGNRSWKARVRLRGSWNRAESIQSAAVFQAAGTSVTSGHHCSRWHQSCTRFYCHLESMKSPKADPSIRSEAASTTASLLSAALPGTFRTSILPLTSLLPWAPLFPPVSWKQRTELRLKQTGDDRKTGESKRRIGWIKTF